MSKNNIATFILKAYGIVSDPATDGYISWGVDGKTLVVHDIEGFTGNVIPLHFRHANFASFVRQLNMYGFR